MYNCTPPVRKTLVKDVRARGETGRGPPPPACGRPHAALPRVAPTGRRPPPHAAGRPPAALPRDPRDNPDPDPMQRPRLSQFRLFAPYQLRINAVWGNSHAALDVNSISRRPARVPRGPSFSLVPVAFTCGITLARPAGCCLRAAHCHGRAAVARVRCCSPSLRPVLLVCRAPSHPCSSARALVLAGVHAGPLVSSLPRFP